MMDAVAPNAAAAAPARLSQPRNLVELVLAHGRSAPHRTALLCEGAEGNIAISYGDLLARTARFAAALRRRDLHPGARILVLVRPDADVYALLLAILSCGMTLVIVDGRQGWRRLIGALGDARADAIIGPRKLLRLWPLLPSLRRAQRFESLEELLGDESRAPQMRALPVGADTPAIISFSSGNTGRAKAVVRTHSVLLAQHQALSLALPLQEDDVNLPGFPVATLHNLCCGTTTVLPSDDLRAMVTADPHAVLTLIAANSVTSLSGAPAYMGQLARAVLEGGIPARNIRRVAVGGGPVGRALCDDIVRAFPSAESHVVYGATEAEPIATIAMREVIDATGGAGFLVGRPVASTDVRLEGADGKVAPAGEIAVRGDHVAGAESWHRTGDIGRRDADGRIWLLGRVGSAVMVAGRAVHPYVAEAAALSVHGVVAAALVTPRRAGDAQLVIQIDECEEAAREGEERVVARLRDALALHGLENLRVRTCPAIPMDARHGSKVARRELSRMLAWEER
jgi:olefin beta-lactone synthetase